MTIAAESLAVNVEFTATQTKMLAVLSDGLPHTREELFACIPDQLSSLNAINQHLSQLRKLIRPVGQDIICVLVSRRIMYRQVRLLHSPNDGRK